MASTAANVAGSLFTQQVSDAFVNKAAEGAGYMVGAGAGRLAWQAAEPVIQESAQRADAYITSFPVQRNCEGDVIFSPPEAITLWGGVAIILAGSTGLGTAAIILSTAMKTRRMYAQNQCAIQ